MRSRSPLFDIPDAFEHLALRAVIVSTLVGVLAAALVYAIVARVASDPNRTFTIVAVIALVALAGRRRWASASRTRPSTRAPTPPPSAR